jgi:hypothetical protein
VDQLTDVKPTLLWIHCREVLGDQVLEKGTKVSFVVDHHITARDRIA